jgi:anti-sigma regulatory factor (Ser/Thr protein kinase)
MSGYVGTVPGHSAAPAAESQFDAATRPALRMTELVLAPLDTAVPSARLHTRHVVREWELLEWAEDCELIVAELVTNAVAACARLARGILPPPVRLRLTAQPYSVQIEVWDGSDDLPELGRSQRADEPGGWGLVLVDALTARWGTYRTVGGGKCVWAVVGDWPRPTIQQADHPNTCPPAATPGMRGESLHD